MIIPDDNEKYEHYIERILSFRDNIKITGEYQEKHHINPKCLGGSNDTNNLIWLYPQEHYYAHKLLHEQYPDNIKLSYAWWNMCTANKNGRECKIDANDYAEAKKIISNDISSNRCGVNNPNFGKPFTEEHREKISKAKLGKKFTEEHIKNISLYHADVSGAMNPRAIQIRCIESGIVFDTIAEASSYYEINRNAIRKFLNGKQSYAGKDKKNNIKLHWELL